MRPSKPPRLIVEVVAPLLCLVVGVMIARAMIDHSRPQPGPYTQALLRGVETSRALDAESRDDPALRDDEFGLGAMWARSHRPTYKAECPEHSTSFREGCAAYIDAVHR